MLDISAFWLKINYFFLSHKGDLKKWWVIILIAVDVFIVVFVFTNIIMYSLGIAKQNRLMIAMAVSPLDYQAIRAESSPQSLEAVSTTVLLVPNGKYDLVGIIRNSNKNWKVTSVDYKFSVNGAETEVLNDSILPNSDKYLTALGVSQSGVGGSADISLIIENLEWERIIMDESLLTGEFLVENVIFDSTVADDLTIYWVKADLTNTGYKSYWQTKFIIVLYSGEKIVGIKYVYFDQFKAGEQRSAYAQWELITESVSGVAILPDFDLLDEENIIK